MLRIGLVGASGYSGAELLRLLLQHPDCDREQLRLFSSNLDSIFAIPKKLRRNQQQGGPLQEGVHYQDYALHYPAFHGQDLKLYGLPAANAPPAHWQEFYDSFDVLFLATPHAASARLVGRYFEEQQNPKQAGQSTRIIDLSGALRLKQPELYREWYCEETLSGSLLARCQYGLSELFRDDIRKANVIANPGCYATATILALAPLAEQGLLGQKGLGNQVRIDAKSGVSGAGKKAGAGTHFPQINESLALYKLHRHQHIPEIEQALAYCAGRLKGGVVENEIPPLTFSSHLLPITRGIMVTCYIQLAAQLSESHLHDLYHRFYADSPFVQVRPMAINSMPQIQDVSFSNRCDIGLGSNPRNGELLVLAVIDNLLKGAAGQAVQNMNLMLGFDEQRGLPLVGALP